MSKFSAQFIQQRASRSSALIVISASRRAAPPRRPAMECSVKSSVASVGDHSVAGIQRHEMSTYVINNELKSFRD